MTYAIARNHNVHMEALVLHKIDFDGEVSWVSPANLGGRHLYLSRAAAQADVDAIKRLPWAKSGSFVFNIIDSDQRLKRVDPEDAA